MTALFPEGLAAVEAPALVIAFLSPAYPMDSMAGELQAALGSVPLIGCSTSGELTDGRFLRHSLVLWALGGAGFSVRVGMGQGELGSLRVASRRAARCLDGLPSHPHRVLVLPADGLCGDLKEVVRGAYEVTGASVPLVGGCAGGDMAMRSTSQIFGARVLNQALVSAVIGSDSPIGIGVSHSLLPVGEPMLVTSSSGVSVKSLDDRPALDVYLETLKAPQASASREAFAAFVATHPLGIPRRDRIEIRYVAGADLETRSLTCIAGLPQGGMTMFMQGEQRVGAGRRRICLPGGLLWAGRRRADRHALLRLCGAPLGAGERLSRRGFRVYAGAAGPLARSRFLHLRRNCPPPWCLWIPQPDPGGPGHGLKRFRCSCAGGRRGRRAPLRLDPAGDRKPPAPHRLARG